MSNELWLSPISVWELIVLWQKGRMVPGEDMETWVPNALQTLPLQEAPVTYEVARETGRLRLPRRDLADRFLLATAKVFELTLVTADEHLLQSRDVSVLANRESRCWQSVPPKSTKQLRLVSKTQVAISFTLTRTRDGVKLSAQ
jgi:PIN domain nuclease of toxin-antitoxin system